MGKTFEEQVSEDTEMRKSCPAWHHPSVWCSVCKTDYGMNVEPKENEVQHIVLPCGHPQDVWYDGNGNAYSGKSVHQMIPLMRHFLKTKQWPMGQLRETLIAEYEARECTNA